MGSSVTIGGQRRAGVGNDDFLETDANWKTTASTTGTVTSFSSSPLTQNDRAARGSPSGDAAELRPSVGGIWVEVLHLKQCRSP